MCADRLRPLGHHALIPKIFAILFDRTQILFAFVLYHRLSNSALRSIVSLFYTNRCRRKNFTKLEPKLHNREYKLPYALTHESRYQARSTGVNNMKLCHNPLVVAAEAEAEDSALSTPRGPNFSDDRRYPCAPKQINSGATSTIAPLTNQRTRSLTVTRSCSQIRLHLSYFMPF